jgi:predicted transcriptional regulator
LPKYKNSDIVTAMNWSELIKELLAAGITQAEIAAAAGAKQSSISDLSRAITQDPRYSTGAALIEFARGRLPADKYSRLVRASEVQA